MSWVHFETLATVENKPLLIFRSHLSDKHWHILIKTRTQAAHFKKRTVIASKSGRPDTVVAAPTADDTNRWAAITAEASFGVIPTVLWRHGTSG